MWPPSCSVFALVALFLSLLGAHTAVAQPPCAESWPSEGLNLAARLNDGEIRAHIDLGYPADSENGVSGVFFYPERWTPWPAGDDVEMSLDGTLTDDCQIRLTDSAGGVWQLRFAPGDTLEGSREAPGGAAASVSLRIIEPADCSGRGDWINFSSPRWPITFDYPASWRLAENGDQIVIECPDAARMAWGGAPIWFELGRGRQSFVSEDGRSGTRIVDFVTFDNDQWLVGPTCEERLAEDLGVFCNPARRSPWQGMTVLQGAAGEHRRYRPGAGYVGQGGGVMRYLFLLGDAWVRIDSEDTPASINDVQSEGPVIFDGDGVTERLVRSIRHVNTAP